MFSPALFLISAQTFDLSFPAAPVSRVVAQLAAKSGEPLSVDSAVGKEMVALDFHKVTLQVAMNRLAKGLHATWKTGSPSITLVRTSDDLAEERKRYAAFCRQALRGEYKASKEESFDPQEMEGLGKKYAEMVPKWRENPDNVDVKTFRSVAQKLRSMEPDYRLSERLSSVLNPKFYEALGKGHFVFCSRPNKRQLPLTPELSASFAQFLGEDAEARKLGLSSYLETSATPPAYLKVVCDVDEKSVVARFRVLDRANKEGLHGGFCGTASTENAQKPVLQKKPNAPNLPEFLPWGLPQDETPIPASLTERLSNVITTDPLTPIGERLIQCAAARGDELFAVLSDELLFAAAEKSTPTDAALIVYARRGFEIREADNYLEFGPYDRPAARRSQWDRNVLQDWLRLNGENRSPALANLFRISPRIPIPTETYAMSSWQTRIGSADTAWNTPIIAFAARLPRGRDVPLDRLVPDIRKAMTEELIAKGPGDFREGMGVAFCGTGWETSPDVTDLPARTISPAAVVHVEESFVPAFVCVFPHRAFSAKFCHTVETLDHGVAAQTDRPLQIGNLHRLEISVRLGPGKDDVYLNRVEAFEISKAPATASDLPPALLAAAKRADERQRDADKPIGGR